MPNESLSNGALYAQTRGAAGVANVPGSADQDGLHAWLGVSWLIFYLMFILFLLYKRKANIPGAGAAR